MRHSRNWNAGTPAERSCSSPDGIIRSHTRKESHIVHRSRTRVPIHPTAGPAGHRAAGWHAPGQPGRVPLQRRDRLDRHRRARDGSQPEVPQRRRERPGRARDRRRRLGAAGHGSGEPAAGIVLRASRFVCGAACRRPRLDGHGHAGRFRSSRDRRSRIPPPVTASTDIPRGLRTETTTPIPAAATGEMAGPSMHARTAVCGPGRRLLEEAL